MRAGKAKYQNHIVIALVLFLVANAVTMIQYKIPTIMSPIMEQFGIDATLASWLMSIFTFVGIVVALPTGFLAKRFGSKNMMIVGVVIACSASLLGGSTSNVAVLIVSRALEGVALVFVVACGPIVIQKCVDPAKIGTATGVWMLGGMLGATFAGVLTPTLYNAVGFVGLCIAYAVLCAVAGLLLLFVVRMPLENPAFASATCGRDRIRRAPSNDSNGYGIFCKKNTWLFLMPFAIFQMILLTVLSYAPTFMQQQGMSAARSGLVSTLPMLLAIISSTVFGMIADKTQRCKPLYLMGMLVMGPCALVLLSTTGPLMWVAVVVMGLFAMGTPAVIVTAYPKILGRPGLLSIGMGVLLLAQSLGQFLGTFVSSNLLGPDLSGWAICGVVTMLLGFFGSVLVGFCKFK